MLFTVTFFCEQKDGDLVENIGKAGIDILDDVLENNPEFTEKDYKHINIDDDCPINGSSYSLDVPIDLARKSKLFAGVTVIRVLVPAGILSKFVRLESSTYKCKRCVKSGISLPGFVIGRKYVDDVYLSVVYVFSDEGLLQEWADRAFSLDWT